MIIEPLPKTKRKHRRRPRVPTPPAPQALALTSATFDDVGPWLTLGFDRAIDIDALVGATIEVNDAFITGFRFVGTATATLVDAQTVRLTMIDSGSSTGTLTTLSASSASGIVAVDDGGTWAGATDLQLPFP